MKVLTTIICGALLVLLGIVSCDDAGVSTPTELETNVKAEVEKILADEHVVLTYPSTDTNGATALTTLGAILADDDEASAAITALVALKTADNATAFDAAVAVAVSEYTAANPITPEADQAALTDDQITEAITAAVTAAVTAAEAAEALEVLKAAVTAQVEIIFENVTVTYESAVDTDGASTLAGLEAALMATGSTAANDAIVALEALETTDNTADFDTAVADAVADETDDIDLDAISDDAMLTDEQITNAINTAINTAGAGAPTP